MFQTGIINLIIAYTTDGAVLHTFYLINIHRKPQAHFNNLVRSGAKIGMWKWDRLWTDTNIWFRTSSKTSLYNSN